MSSVRSGGVSTVRSYHSSEDSHHNNNQSNYYPDSRDNTRYPRDPQNQLPRGDFSSNNTGNRRGGVGLPAAGQLTSEEEMYHRSDSSGSDPDKNKNANTPGRNNDVGSGSPPTPSTAQHSQLSQSQSVQPALGRSHTTGEAANLNRGRNMTNAPPRRSSSPPPMQSLPSSSPSPSPPPPQRSSNTNNDSDSNNGPGNKVLRNAKNSGSLSPPAMRRQESHELPPQQPSRRGSDYTSTSSRSAAIGGGPSAGVSASEHRSRLNDDDEYYAQIQQENGDIRYDNNEYYGSSGGPGGGGRYITRNDDEYSNHGRMPSSAAVPNSRPTRQDSVYTSETLSKAEEDFLSKYGYARNELNGDDEDGHNDDTRHHMNHPSHSNFPNSSHQSVDTFDTRESSIISRPNMERMGMNDGQRPPPPSYYAQQRPPSSDDRDRHRPLPIVMGSGQSVTSQMSESIISAPGMARAPSGPPPDRRPHSSNNNYNQPPPVRRHASGESYERGGGSIYPRVDGRGSGGGASRGRPGDPRRSPYDDYGGDRDYGGGGGMERGFGGGGGGASIERGMDDAPRRGIQRIPSQSTISTSGFRSFYSDAFTMRDQNSVDTGYRHQYGGMSIASRSSYGNDLASRSSYGNDLASYESRGGASRGYGGGGGGGSYYGQGPPSYNQPPPRSGNSPPYGRASGGGGSYARDYSPRRPPPPPPPQPTHSDRPLLEVAPGLLMHLMGTDETMKAIQQGQITVTSCVVCGMDVHCHSESEYVLCPDCRVVSPVNQLDNANMTPQQGGLVGLGVKTEMLLTMMEAAGNRQY